MKAEIELSKIKKIQIYVAKRAKTIAQIKTETGADYIINGGLFDMSYKDNPNLWLRVDGKTLSVAPDTTGNGKPDGFWCYGWNDSNIKIIHSDNIATVQNAICCTTMIKDGKKTTMHYDSAQGGTRGRTAIGTTANKLVLFCSKDGTSEAQSPEKLQTYMFNLGCKDVIMFDSGGSSSCDFNGSKVTTTRKCHNYICVYLNKTTSGTTTPTSGTTSSVTAKIGTYKVNATTLNIRSGAGTNYSKVGTYEKDTKINVTAIFSNGWGKTDKGYVSMDYLIFVSSTIDTSNTLISGTYKVKASSLNIRSGAGTIFSKVGSYTNGTTIEVSSIINGWGKTSRGWVSMSYLTKIETVSMPVVNTPSLREQFVTFALSQVGKNEADGDDDVYIKWYNSVIGTKFAMTVSWCSIWVSYNARHVNIPTSQILTTASCTSAMTWFKKQGTWRDAHNDYSPRRADLIYFNTDGNDNNVEHVGIVTKNDGTRVYTVEGNSSNSVKENSYLLTDVKVFGYVDWDKSGKVTITTTSKVVTGTVTASALNVRSGAGTNYKIVKSIPKGSKITILSTSESWYKIADGYVSKQYVKLD